MTSPSVAMKQLEELAQELVLEGFDVQQLTSQLLDFFISRSERELPDLKKARIMEVIAETEMKLKEGGSEEINLLYMLS